MKRILFLLIVFSPFIASSQNCNCDSNFQWLKSYLERNYPGFKTKVNSQTLAAYNTNTQKYRALIKQSTKAAYCKYYISQWLKFFKDKHIQLVATNDVTFKTHKDTEEINELDKSTEIIPLDSTTFVKSLNDASTLNPQGVYISDDSTYTIALVKNKNVFRDYAGIILNSKTIFWRRGEVKIELKQETDSTYNMIQYMRNHSINIYREPVKLIQDGKLYEAGWKRIVPVPKIKTVKVPENKTSTEGENLNTYYKNISPDLSYLRIYSFDDSYRHEIDSVIAADMNQIKSHKYMILDLRYNGGGSDGSYQSLMPIVYSNPVPSIGVDIYSTPDNIIAIKRMMKEDAQYLSSGDVRWFDSLIDVMKTHPDEFISQGPDDTTTFDSVMHYPQKVAILVNRYCASTTEQFLLFAKECKKVTIMGENTEGELDYSNIRPVDFPSLPVTLYYPVTLSRRVALHQGIDGLGITPAIRLQENADWVKEAENYLLKQ